jgi:hypothetical protein
MAETVSDNRRASLRVAAQRSHKVVERRSMIVSQMPDSTNVLVRYGAVPEVAHFRAAMALPILRGLNVVVATHRGEELGTVLESLRPSPEPQRNDEEDTVVREVVRLASDEDVQRRAAQQADAHREFPRWEQRIAEWNLDLQLIDLEWTLDRHKLILYVLNDRGPESTKLALQAAAAGLGIVEVQPVSREGLVSAAPSSGCGSCGCHN